MSIGMDEGLMRLQMESEAPGLNQRPPIGANHLMIISSHTIRQSITINHLMIVSSHTTPRSMSLM